MSLNHNFLSINKERVSDIWKKNSKIRRGRWNPTFCEWGVDLSHAFQLRDYHLWKLQNKCAIVKCTYPQELVNILDYSVNNEWAEMRDRWSPIITFSILSYGNFFNWFQKQKIMQSVLSEIGRYCTIIL